MCTISADGGFARPAQVTVSSSGCPPAGGLTDTLWSLEQEEDIKYNITTLPFLGFIRS